MSQRGKPLSSELIRPLVEGRTGEVSVILENTRDRRMIEIRLTLSNHPVSSAVSQFEITPSKDDGGYTIAEVLPGERVRRSFCVTPLHAEVGRSYGMEAVAFYKLEQARLEYDCEAEQGREVQSASDIHAFKLKVEARPEVYAAIGAVEKLRKRLLERYDDLVETGKRAHGEQTTLPGSNGVEPAHVALGEGSFKFLLEAIELGARLLRVPADRARRESQTSEPPRSESPRSDARRKQSGSGES